MMINQTRTERIERERWLLELRRSEAMPAHLGAPPAPPMDDAARFESWLRAARLWRDLRRQRR